MPGVSAAAENETFPCRSCGAQLAVSVASEDAQCTHCGATTEIPLSLRRRVEQHRQAVEQVRGETRRPGDDAAATAEQTERLEPFARQRRDEAHADVMAAPETNDRSLDGFAGGLAWLTSGPLGFGPFFAVTMLAAGLILFVAMAAAPGMLRAAWISLAVCGGMAVLGVVWGLVVALQRLFWTWLLANSGPRWRPRWELVRDAVGDMPAFAVAAVAGFGLLAASIWRDTSENAVGAAVVMLALGSGLAFLVLVFAAARVLWAIAAALLRR